MKVLVLLLFPICLFAQTERYYAITSNTGVTLTTVDNISNYNGQAPSIHVSDSIRGGTFFLYTGSDEVDNGMVFTDANNNKWKRSVTDGKILITWYGARQNGVIDCRPLFLQALNYAYKHPNFREIHLPWDSIGTDSQNVYLFSDSVLIDRNIKITGVGFTWFPKTQVWFSPNKSGFVFKFDTTKSAFCPTIENIKFRQGTSTSTSIAAIKSNTQIHINNVEIRNWSGNGIFISACANLPSGDNNNYGNASNSIIENSTIIYCLNGIFTEGCDVNICEFRNVVINQNKRWGAFINGMLGDFFSKPHASANGTPQVGGNSVVTYNGLYYSARPGYDGYYQDATDSNYNKQPDINPTYWYEVTPMSAAAWNNTTRYYSGGPICIKNPNAWTNIYHAYTEGFQPKIYLNARSKVDGGDNGSGVENGAFWNMSLGEQQLLNSTLYLQKPLRINAANISNNFFHVKNQSGIPYSGVFEGYNTISAIQFRNISGIHGEFDYINSDFKWYVNSQLVGTLNSLGFTATKFFGDGSALTGIAGGSGISQQTLNDTAAAIRAAIPTVGGGATRVFLPNNVINNNAVANTLADVTGLTFPVVAGSRYAFKVVIVYNSSATTTGSRWVINGPAATDMSYTSQYPTSATAITNNTSLAGYNLPSASNASSLTTNNRCIIQGEILPSANGSVQVRFASEISASAITAIAGRSYLEYQIIN